MQYTILDFISLSIFLSSTVLIISVRKVFLIDEDKTYQTLVAGFSILSTVSLLNLLAYNQILDSVPFLNVSIFFKTVYWIGMITGLTFVLHGVSRWLPVYREFKTLSHTRITELEIFRKAEQIIQIDKKIPSLFDSMLKLIVQTYPVLCGGTYLKDSKTGVLTLSSFHCVQDEHVFDTNDVGNLISEYATGTTIQSAIVNRKLQNTIVSVLPVYQTKYLVGLFVLNTGVELKSDVVESLKLLVDILESKITFIESLDDSQTNRIHVHWVEKVINDIDVDKSLKDNLSSIFTLIKEKVNLDHLSVCIPDNNYAKKMMLGANGQILDYVYDSYAENRSIENYSLSYNQPMIVNDLKRETDFFIDPLLLKMDCVSLLTIPVKKDDIELLLILSSYKKSAFSRTLLTQIEPVLLHLEKIMQNEKRNNELADVESLKESLISFALDSIRTDNTKELNSSYLNLINSTVDTMFTRISLFDYDRRFLHSQALITTTPHLTMTPENGMMMIDLMPGHMKAMKTGKLCSFSNGSNLTLEEQVQIYGRTFGSMVVVPVTTDNQVKGFVTFGFNQGQAQPDSTIQKFLNDATILYAYARRNITDRQLMKEQNSQLRLQNNDLVTNKTMNRLKSSVSSMLGSMELLQSTDKNDERFQTYLNMAGKSAQSMSKLFVKEEETIAL